ncbi:unnamed protein product [Penicillium salamii]|nr:unnamed protein product [Penicillium salamii]CAG8265331.1 unnamed protein product [Penicillium salamii]
MAAWLDLCSDTTGRSLVDTGRLNEIVQGMSHPNSQYPSFVYFAGNGNRIKALQALFPRNNITRKGPTGLIRAHLSTATAHTENPIIFAESNLFSQAGVGDTSLLRWSGENHQRYPISLGESQPLAELQQEVIRQKVLPWTQVLCLFVDTVSEMQAVQQLLDAPFGTLSIGTQTIPRLMRVVIVLSENSKSEITEADMGFETPTAWIGRHKVTILDIRDRSALSSNAAFEPLRRLVLDEVQGIQKERKRNCLSISAVHLNAFWGQNIQLQMKGSNPNNLDCLSVARSAHKSDKAIASCLVEFQSQIGSSASHESEVYNFIASALLLDAYPPEMHLFEPEIIFNALYRSYCRDAWPESSEKACVNIVDQFIMSFAQLGPKKTSVAIRRESLARFYRRWGGLHSTTTCFSCMCRPPEHMLPCRHAICDTCVVMFGTASSRAEYHTDLSKCPICDKSLQLTVRRLPPTKRPIVVSLDGGGVRGILQLGLLRELERRLGGISIAQISDLCIGTSVGMFLCHCKNALFESRQLTYKAGALSEMDIILNDISAEESYAKFPELAQMIFKSSSKSESRSPIPRCIKIVKYLAGFLADCQYDSDNLENILQKVVDPQRRIFDVMKTSAGCRVAIITSRISDGKACVLANYRGKGHRDLKAAYQFLTPQTDIENPFLRDAAQCSIAAPFIFRTKSLPGFGLLQDGGVRANNPLAIGLKESTVIWPLAKTHDLLLSVGTGRSSFMAKQDKASRSFWRDSAIPRMIRATMSSPSMDGEQGFHEALNLVPDDKKPNIFRLNHEVSEALPRLDDVSRLAEMSKMRFAVPDELVRAILVTAFFFFELDGQPIKKHGVYFCQGSILCSRSYAKDLVKKVMVEFPGARFQTARGHHLGDVVEDDSCHLCGYYRKEVNFSVNGLDEMTTIGIAGSSFFQRIGGFPKSVQELLEDQQANSHFGREDHLVDCWPPKRNCYCPPRAKRQVEFQEPALEHKKRRL